MKKINKVIFGVMLALIAAPAIARAAGNNHPCNKSAASAAACDMDFNVAALDVNLSQKSSGSSQDGYWTGRRNDKNSPPPVRSQTCTSIAQHHDLQQQIGQSSSPVREEQDGKSDSHEAVAQARGALIGVELRLTPLQKAARRGDHKELKEMLEAMETPEEKMAAIFVPNNLNGRTVLHDALLYDKKFRAPLCTDKYQDLGTRLCMVFIICEQLSPEAVDRLIQTPDYDELTPLALANTLDDGGGIFDLLQNFHVVPRVDDQPAETAVSPETILARALKIHRYMAPTNSFLRKATDTRAWN